MEDMNANMQRAAKPEQPGESAHVAGYLEAHERVADGDADSPDDGELWVPDDLDTTTATAGSKVPGRISSRNPANSLLIGSGAGVLLTIPVDDNDPSLTTMFDDRLARA